MKFVASDGKVFDDFHACEAYEDALSKHDCKCESCSCDKVSSNSQLTEFGFVLYATDGTIIPVNDIQNPNRKKIKYVKISNYRTAFLALKNTFMHCGINTHGIDNAGAYVYCHGMWYNIDDKAIYENELNAITDSFELIKQEYEQDIKFYTDLAECIKKWDTFNK